MTAKKPTSRRKTKKTFGEEIIEGLQELRDVLESGEPIEERFTTRTVDLELEPHDYSPEDVKATFRRPWLAVCSTSSTRTPPAGSTCSAAARRRRTRANAQREA